MDTFRDQSKGNFSFEPISSQPPGTAVSNPSGQASGARPKRKVVRALLISKSETDSRMVELLLTSRKSRLLNDVDFRLINRDSIQRGVGLLVAANFDVVLLDLNCCHSIRLDSLERVVSVSGGVPIIVLGDDLSLTTSVRILQRGAEDSLDKGELTAHHLSSSILHSIERNERLNVEHRLTSCTADQQAAGLVQAALLPDSPPVYSGLEIAGACNQARQVGGDYFDFFEFSPHQFGFVLADVSSHGFAPALIMAGLRRLLRTLVQTTHDIGSIVTLANKAILEDTLDNQFVTLFLGCIDASEKTLNYVSAGHPAYLISDSGNVIGLHDTNLPLGIADTHYQESETISLKEFQLLFAVTDGYTETISPNGEMCGIERVANSVVESAGSAPEEIIGQLTEVVNEFRGNAPQADDCAAIIVKFE